MTALIALAYAFPGGDLGALARTVADWRKEPTVALIQGTKDWSQGVSGLRPEVPRLAAAVAPRFELEAASVGDPKRLARLLGTKAKVEAGVRAGGVALWHKVFEDETTRPPGGSMPLPRAWTEAKTTGRELQGGRVSFDLPAQQAILVDKIAEMGWSKPIKVHWLLGKMWVVPVAKDAGEKAFLGALATAVSGMLVDTKEGYRIDLDPTAFRLRAQATVLARAPQGVNGRRSAIQQAGVDIAVETWRWMDDATLLDLYRERTRAIARVVKQGTPLDRALTRYYAAYKRQAENGTPDRTNGIGGMRSLLELIDESRPPKVFVSQNLGTGGGWPKVGGGTVFLD